MPGSRPTTPTVVGLGGAQHSASPGPVRTVTPIDRSCPVGALSHLPQLMREAGHDPWHLLESFGVTPAMMAQPMSPIPIALHGQILQAAADATGRADLGLLIGQRATMENAGPLRLLVFNSRTTREAVESLVRYLGIWYRGIDLTLTSDQGYACLSVSVDGKFPGREHFLTAYLAALVKLLEGIFSRAWRPSQVHISYRRPAQAEHYSRFFRAPVLYDQPRHAVFFPEAALNETRPGSEQMLDSFLRQYMGELEAREQTHFVERVRQVIDSLLATGDCSIVRVADMFAVHRVTLHRHLRQHGTTFEALLEESRRALATRMLEQTDLPVGEIATTLGYGSAGSFVRAYRRWYGVTPGIGRHRSQRLDRSASRQSVGARR